MNSRLLAMDRAGLWVVPLLSSPLFYFLAAHEADFLLPLILVPMLGMLGTIGATKRLSVLEAVLPVEGGELVRRRIWLMCARIGVMATLFLTMSVVRLGKIWWEGWIATAAVALIAIASVLLLHLVRRDELQLPDWVSAVAWIPFAPLGLVSAEVLFTIGVLAVAVLLPKTLAAIPKTYHLPSDRPWTGEWQIPAITPAFRWKPILRTMLEWQMLWGLICFYNMAEDLLSLAPVMLWGFLRRCFVASPWLYSLPLRRQTHFLTAALVYLLLLGTLMALPQFGSPVRVAHGKMFRDRGAKEGTPNVQVKLRYWQPAAEAPVIRAPWGETARAATSQMLWQTVHNPFTVEPRNSQRFLEWQFERATASIYGSATPFAKRDSVNQRTPVAGDARVLLVEFSLIASFGFAVWIAYCYVCRRIARWMGAVFFAAPLLLVMATAWYADIGSRDAVSGFLFQRLLPHLPDSPMATTLLCLSLVAITGTWAAHKFAEFDAQFAEPTMGVNE